MSSLSPPGLSFWMKRVGDPSSPCFMFGIIGELTRKRLIGFSIRSGNLSNHTWGANQKAFTGGYWPAGTVMVSLSLLQSSVSPLSQRVYVYGEYDVASNLQRAAP